MITYKEKKLTAKQAAKIIIEEGVGQSLDHWYCDTSAGEEIDCDATPRERAAIDDQISKILTRMSRFYVDRP